MDRWTIPDALTSWDGETANLPKFLSHQWAKEICVAISSKARRHRETRQTRRKFSLTTLKSCWLPSSPSTLYSQSRLDLSSSSQFVEEFGQNLLSSPSSQSRRDRFWRSDLCCLSAADSSASKNRLRLYSLRFSRRSLNRFERAKRISANKLEYRKKIRHRHCRRCWRFFSQRRFCHSLNRRLDEP